MFWFGDECVDRCDAFSEAVIADLGIDSPAFVAETLDGFRQLLDAVFHVCLVEGDRAVIAEVVEDEGGLRAFARFFGLVELRAGARLTSLLPLSDVVGGGEGVAAVADLFARFLAHGCFPC